MKLRFVLFMGLRYFKAKRKSSGLASSLLSMIGVGVGVMALTAVLGVMNGFQLGFIESILEVSSYHLQIKAGQGVKEEKFAELENLRTIQSVISFTESQAIAEGKYVRQRGCRVRGLPVDILRRDPGFRNSLEITAGVFDLRPANSIVIGVELARHLGLAVGEEIVLTALAGDSSGKLAPKKESFTISALFRSGYYEYDLGLVFVANETAVNYFWPEKRPPLTLGIKLENQFHLKEAEEEIAAALREAPGSWYKLVTWRDYNRAFFSALRMEKIIMMLLIGLIFIVVGFNIYHTLRRTVRERYEEIALLKAIGAPGSTIQYIFILDGFLIGCLGAGVGMAMGLLITGNINEVFGIVETLINLVLGVMEFLFVMLSTRGMGEFSIFSPAYFYLIEVPSKVLLPEALLILLLGLLSATMAAYFASQRVAEIKPVQILQYE